MLMVGVVSVHYARLFAIALAQMGPNLVSVTCIWNSGMSAVEGF